MICGVTICLFFLICASAFHHCMIAKGTSHSVTAASVQTSKSQTPGNNPKYHRFIQSREEYILYIKEVLFYFHHWSVTCSHSHGCWCGYCTFSCNVTAPILSLNHCKAFFYSFEMLLCKNDASYSCGMPGQKKNNVYFGEFFFSKKKQQM